MKATLKLEDGREIQVELSEKDVDTIIKPKKTGWERAEIGEYYKYIYIGTDTEDGHGQTMINTKKDDTFRAMTLPLTKSVPSSCGYASSAGWRSTVSRWAGRAVLTSTRFTGIIWMDRFAFRVLQSFAAKRFQSTLIPKSTPSSVSMSSEMS